MMSKRPSDRRGIAREHRTQQSLIICHLRRQRTRGRRSPTPRENSSENSSESESDQFLRRAASTPRVFDGDTNESAPENPEGVDSELVGGGTPSISTPAIEQFQLQLYVDKGTCDGNLRGLRETHFSGGTGWLRPLAPPLDLSPLRPHPWICPLSTPGPGSAPSPPPPLDLSPLHPRPWICPLSTPAPGSVPVPSRWDRWDLDEGGARGGARRARTCSRSAARGVFIPPSGHGERWLCSSPGPVTPNLSHPFPASFLEFSPRCSAKKFNKFWSLVEKVIPAKTTCVFALCPGTRR